MRRRANPAVQHTCFTFSCCGVLNCFWGVVAAETQLLQALDGCIDVGPALVKHVSYDLQPGQVRSGKACLRELWPRLSTRLVSMRNRTEPLLSSTM